MALPAKARAADHPAPDRSASADQLDLALADLRQAMADTGWTVDALAAAMSAALDRVIDRGYAYRLVNGDKPWKLAYTVALPDDLEGRWNHLRAERFGRVVVQPLSGLDAQKAFVAGLVGLMSAPTPLPVKADRLAKAALPLQTKATGTR